MRRLYLQEKKLRLKRSPLFSRKIQQLIVDEITFVFSGVIALAAFWFLVPQPPLGVTILSWVELLLLIVLGSEMFIYADLAEGR